MRCGGGVNFLLDEHLQRRAEPVRLPPPLSPARPSPFPFIAAVVPLVAAGGMWAVTGSPMMLWFAVLTPFMLVGSLWDRRRGRRREERVHRRIRDEAIASASSVVVARHDEERVARAVVHPDLWGLCTDPANVWRTHAQRAGTVVVGTGTVAVPPVIAEDPDGDERVAQLRARSATLTGAPIVIPLDGDVCVRGPLAVRRAVVRALLLQVCVVHAPGAWQLVGAVEEWQRLLPHRAPAAGARTLAMVSGVEPADADVVIRDVAGGTLTPPGTATLIDVGVGLQAALTRGPITCDVALEGVSMAQAEALAAALARRAADAAPLADTVLRFGELDAGPRGTLGVTVGRAGADETWLDLVDDGPHAIVVGTTGAGKSEFLITWALALCRSRSPREVMLILADFKGGTAFEPLAGLPHVAGVITDLDGALAERAVRSLAAEVRRREAELARVGARDVSDPRCTLPRLVVMVDEFPALVTQHPELEAVFTDISARGRALGIHLVLGGQRVSGVVRPATLTNCALRVALRVSDPLESRTVIGEEHAARLPGGTNARGLAYIRRAGDAGPERVRVALTSADDIAAVAARGDAPSDEPAPWLPPLPPQVDRSDLADDRGIALADLPDVARRDVVRLRADERGLVVIGGPRSGKTAAARIIAATEPAAIVMSADPERAWDQLAAAENEPPSMLVCDDVDVLATRYPEPWAGEFVARCERVIARSAASQTTLVFTASRASGSLGRALNGVPRRAILALPTRADHIAAGGEPRDHVGHRPPGRGMLDGFEVQFGWSDPSPDDDSTPTLERWAPTRGSIAGWVTRMPPARVARAAHRWGVSVIDVADVPAGVDASALAGTVLVGDPEQWQRAWHIGEMVRREGELIIGSECAPEYRVLTGDRRLPPYLRSGRAWLVKPGADPVRVDAE